MWLMLVRMIGATMGVLVLALWNKLLDLVHPKDDVRVFFGS